MKKFIAREILFLLSAIGISGLLFLGTFLYNYFKERHTYYLSAEISKTQKTYDRLDYNYDYKLRNQIWFFDAMSKEFDLKTSDSLNTRERFWDYTVKAKVWYNVDSLKRKWDNKWRKTGLTKSFESIGFNTPESIGNFVVSKTLSTKDLEDHKKAILLTKAIDTLKEEQVKNDESKFTWSDQKIFDYQCFILILIIFFGVRYLFYLVKWCLVTLKNT